MKSVFQSACLFASVLALVACNEPDESEICNDCSPGQYGYICAVTTPSQLGCAADATAAENLCPGGVVGGMSCGGGGSGGQQGQDPHADWNPDDYVYFDRATHETVVDRDLIDLIAADGAVLMRKDRTRLVLQPAGYYVLQTVGPDDLAYHLGLRTGDKIKSVNGIKLQKLADYIDAITALANATALSITYERPGAGEVTVDFRID